MKKVFISQPMKGREEIDIINERDAAIAALEDQFGEPVEEVHSYSPANKNGHPLTSLGMSIQCMAEADVAYFCDGWENARGCNIEHECAKQYGIEVIEKQSVS